MVKILAIITLIIFQCTEMSSQVERANMQLQEELSCYWDENVDITSPWVIDSEFLSEPVFAMRKSEFDVFQISENAAYIQSVLELLNRISELKEELEIINTYSNPHFYKTIEFCGCTDLPKQIKFTYKDSWRVISETVDSMKLETSTVSNPTIVEISLAMSSLKSQKKKINSNEINKSIDDNNLQELIDYISKDVIPNHHKRFKDLEVAIDVLNGKLKYFIIITKLFNT